MENVSPCKLPIDWEMLYKAEKYYRLALNSTYIETPWIVEPNVAGITAPSDEIKCSLGQLVGSAEQGFLQLLNDRDPKMEMGRYYHSISPCFRNDVIDELHERHFMKLELIYPYADGNGYVGPYSVLSDMIDKAKELFFELGGVLSKVEPIVDQGYDIVGYKSGIELGSYGIRSAGGCIKWVYGTGLALPRFTLVKEKEKC